MDPGGLVFIFTEAPTKNLELAEALIKTKIRCIHSKSEPHDPNGAAKKFEVSANLSKNATTWPKNDPKWPKVTQSDQNMTPNGPKWPKNDPKWSKITQNGPKLPKMAQK